MAVAATLEHVEAVDCLLDDWRRSHDLTDLWALALIRTPRAVELIASVRDEVDDPEDRGRADDPRTAFGGPGTAPDLPRLQY